MIAQLEIRILKFTLKLNFIFELFSQIISNGGTEPMFDKLCSLIWASVDYISIPFYLLRLGYNGTMITVIIAGGSGTRLWPLSTPDGILVARKDVSHRTGEVAKQLQK